MTTATIHPIGRNHGQLTYAEYVASEVRAACARYEVTQNGLAAALGISQMAVSRRLRGRVAFDIAELAAVAALFGRDVRDFLPTNHDGDPVAEIRTRNGCESVTLPREDSNLQPFGYQVRAVA